MMNPINSPRKSHEFNDIDKLNYDETIISIKPNTDIVISSNKKRFRYCLIGWFVCSFLALIIIIIIITTILVKNMKNQNKHESYGIDNTDFIVGWNGTNFNYTNGF